MSEQVLLLVAALWTVTVSQSHKLLYKCDETDICLSNFKKENTLIEFDVFGIFQLFSYCCCLLQFKQGLRVTSSISWVLFKITDTNPWELNKTDKTFLLVQFSAKRDDLIRNILIRRTGKYIDRAISNWCNNPFYNKKCSKYNFYLALKLLPTDYKRP